MTLRQELEKYKATLVAECGVTRGTEQAGAIQTGFDEALDLLLPCVEALEFYEQAYHTFKDGIVPERIINGGEYVKLGTEAHMALTALRDRIKTK